MNSIDYGISISNQNSTPDQKDFEFISRIRSLLNREDSLSYILEALYGEFENLGTPLSDIGLNIQSVRNIIENFLAKGDEEGCRKVLSEVLDVLSFGFDNEFVFEKYINLLNLFNFKYLRFSLNWNKILHNDSSRPNYEEIEKYKVMCSKLIQNGIEPIITFSHFETGGRDLLSDNFAETFKKISRIVLEQVIPVGVRYWMAFNEPAVLSGGENLGLWGKNDFTFNDVRLELTHLPQTIYNGVKFYTNHLKTLNRIGELAKVFYEEAHKIGEEHNVDIKVIANFNVSVFDKGTSNNLYDKFLVWCANKIDKDLQLDPFRTGPDRRMQRRGREWIEERREAIVSFLRNYATGAVMFYGEDAAKIDPEDYDTILDLEPVPEDQFAIDVLALNPYYTRNLAVFNNMIRNRLKKVLPEDILQKLFPDQSNPDFKNADLVRYGTHDQILDPKAIRKSIEHMIREYGFSEIILTEFGSDTNGRSKEGLENKLWYIESVREELEILKEEGLSIPFALIWTLIRMWEILGPKGGGVGEWDFGILAEPLNHNDLVESLMVNLGYSPVPAAEKAIEIIQAGNNPLRIYNGMIEHLGRIFAQKEINAKQVIESLISNTNDTNALIVNYLQLIEIRKYYEGDPLTGKEIDELLDVLAKKIQYPEQIEA